MTTSTELAVRQNGHIATERDVVDGWIAVAADVSKLSDYIAETDFVPKALRNKPAAIAACILTGRELGIGPMASLKSIHMVQGVPSLSAEYKRARALAAGHQIVIDESTATRCVVRGRRSGSDTWVPITWTMDHARRAKIDGKDVWKQYPQRMLQARATSELCDLLFPDATLGLPTTEDLEDGGALAAAVAIEASAEETRPAAEEPPAPARSRTAQRKPRAAAEPPKTPAPAAPDEKAPAGAGLPPLPGEDDDPADVSDRLRKLRGIIHQHFSRLRFTADERTQRLQATAVLAGMTDPGALASTNELTEEQASVVADTLAKCKDREKLIVLMAAGEKP